MRDQPPLIAEASVRWHGRIPRCGACNRNLQHEKQWRCPYVSCRKWLRGTGTDEVAA